ncbi:unnamed protein product [Allacma fusca]|uniref:Uncharacterized protein n=1 Tax=Allacma fusca TaxID=39272 RepID=A0A8J2JA87_9HEXA|nr:unnamed protein product [Allacma fusca]
MELVIKLENSSPPSLTKAQCFLSECTSWEIVIIWINKYLDSRSELVSLDLISNYYIRDDGGTEDSGRFGSVIYEVSARFEHSKKTRLRFTDLLARINVNVNSDCTRAV